MAKKHSDIADGVKAVYHFQHVSEALHGLTASRAQLFMESLGEMAMIVAALAIICAVFWISCLNIC
jgi:hypothetical protein